MTALVFRFVPHEKVAAYVAAGWRARDSLKGTPHGVYSTLMEWAGTGEPQEPK